LLAFGHVISNQQPLGEFQHQVGDDEVCVLIIEHESDEKARRIFNKVNRHAKPTSQADNIITSEDDGYAIVTRRLMHPGEPLAARELSTGERYEPVEWQKNTLSAASRRLTTLRALYQTVEDILSVNGYPASEFSERHTQVAPPEDLLDSAYSIVERWWSQVLLLPDYEGALRDPDSIPGRRASESSPALLFRPVTQITMMKGLTAAYVTAADRVDLGELVRRIGVIEWTPSTRGMWRDVLVRPDGAMIAKAENYELGARLIEYLLVADLWSEDQRTKLWEDWNVKRGRDPFTPPDTLPVSSLPEDLPEPVVTR
jgi:DNA sulfur modification protein DndB